jgi:transposase
MARKGARSTNNERIRAIQLIERGWSADAISEALDVNRSTVYLWLKKYRDGGLAALSTKFASGRPTALDDQQIIRLYEIIVGKDPRQLDLGSALWTRKLIVDVIHVNFNIALSQVTVGRILKKLGMSPQRPLYRAYQQDPEKVKKWKNETYPEIRKDAKRENAVIFFADEAGIRSDHHAGTTWAPIGCTPTVIADGSRKSVNMISAISAQGSIHFDVFTGRMNADRFIGFCTMLLEDCGQPVYLIVDGSPVHTAKAVQEYVLSTEGKLRIFFLPPYSPQLNPDEWVWKNVKHDQIKRAVSIDGNDMQRLAYRALERLQNMPNIVRAFFADINLLYIREA